MTPCSAFTLASGSGDCDDHARPVFALALAGGLPAAIAFLHHGGPSAQPTHAVAQLGLGGRLRWAETTIDAAFGEHPLDAAIRLGLVTARQDLAREVRVMTEKDLPAPPPRYAAVNPPSLVARDARALDRLGFLAGTSGDARDPTFRGAVAAFQRSRPGLTVDGLIGPQTRAAIGRALPVSGLVLENGNMRPSVRAAFVPFTSPLEGVVPWMYQDVKGLVSTGIGNLIDPISLALPIPFVRADGRPATTSEIAAEWNRIKSQGPDAQGRTAAQLGHRYAKRIATLHLTQEGIDKLVSDKLLEMDRSLAARFAEYPSWPADAQLATLSMAWANGPAFRYPRLASALRSRDFGTAADECRMSEEGNPGLKKRNVLNRKLYLSAARVVAEGRDPDVLNWPHNLPTTIPGGIGGAVVMLVGVSAAAAIGWWVASS